MDGIEIKGLDDVINWIDGIEISDNLEHRALNAGGKIFLNSAKESSPELTGYTKKSIKGGIKRANGDKVYHVTVNAWDAIFSEYGSSKNKAYVGWFSRAIDNVEEQASNTIAEIISEVLD